MMMNDYVAQKLRELEEDHLRRTLIVARMVQESGRPIRKGKPVIGPALRLAGRTLRTVGSGLENWAEPPAADCEQRLGLERRGG
jgi:hypothetical protein